MSKIFDDLFIFEMANSHQGSVEHGKDIIHEMGKIARSITLKQQSNCNTVIWIHLFTRTTRVEKMSTIFQDLKAHG